MPSVWVPTGLAPEPIRCAPLTPSGLDNFPRPFHGGQDRRVSSEIRILGCSIASSTVRSRGPRMVAKRTGPPLDSRNCGRWCGIWTVAGRDVGPILIGEGLARSYGATERPARHDRGGASVSPWLVRSPPGRNKSPGSMPRFVRLSIVVQHSATCFPSYGTALPTHWKRRK